jgi:hypothetical protein
VFTLFIIFLNSVRKTGSDLVKPAGLSWAYPIEQVYPKYNLFLERISGTQV